MRRPFALLLVIALAIPFASAFAQGKAACCCKGATACALKLRAATCAATCSMGKAEPSDVAPIPHGGARQAMAAFRLTAPFAEAVAASIALDLAAPTTPAPPDPPPPRA
jgi:hypothetical protein